MLDNVATMPILWVRLEIRTGIGRGIPNTRERISGLFPAPSSSMLQWRKAQYAGQLT